MFSIFVVMKPIKWEVRGRFLFCFFIFVSFAFSVDEVFVKIATVS